VRDTGNDAKLTVDGFLSLKCCLVSNRCRLGSATWMSHPKTIGLGHYHSTWGVLKPTINYMNLLNPLSELSDSRDVKSGVIDSSDSKVKAKSKTLPVPKSISLSCSDDRTTFDYNSWNV
jgi:hypothetical protein